MKKFLVVLLVALFLPFVIIVSSQQSPDSAHALISFTDTPSPVPTDTPDITITPNITPTNTPDTPPSVTPTGTIPSGTATITNTPPTPGNPTGTPGTSETPVPTPSVIPALGSGPAMTTMMFFAVILLVMSVFLSVGWFRVWRSYKN